MIETLSNLHTDALEADVAIVGAGVAGLILADYLAERGRKVIVLESGCKSQDGDIHPLNEVEIVREPYEGAAHGRARCLGGTSTRWGGALLPFLQGDLAGRQGVPAWPLDLLELTEHLRAVETMFGLAPGPFEPDLPDWPAGDFIPREAKWPRFGRRNVASLLSQRLAASGGPQIILDANLCDFVTKGDGRLASITARSVDGRTLVVTAGTYVLCPGAIEATRLLLWLDLRTGGRALAGRAVLGRFFQDHLSAPLARIETDDPIPLNRLAAFRFDHCGTMRSLRFELASDTRAAKGCGAGFVHIAAHALAPSGFDDIKTFFRSLQRRRPDPKALVHAARDVPFLLQLLRWRLLEKRLYWPQPARYDVHMVIEQAADPNNRIILSKNADVFGVPLAAIDWGRTTSDLMTFRTVAESFAEYFRNTPLAATGRLVFPIAPRDLTIADIAGSGDIFHPTGSTRMGARADESVVDSDLAVFGVRNLHVAATSVFPNGGGANPTMMLAALALRLGEKLAGRHL